MMISIIAPHFCLGCGFEGAVLCQSCRLTSLPAVPSRCYRCHKATQQSKTCLNCRRKSDLVRVFVVTDYDGLAKDVVYKLKFGRGVAAAKNIALAIDDILPQLGSEELIVHVPTVNSRVRQRGYDQAKEIAVVLAKARKLKHKTLLKRVSSARQVGASRKQRFAQLENAFSIKDKNLVRGKNIILVDDVITTGATLESAAKTLKEAGAKSVEAAVFAQA